MTRNHLLHVLCAASPLQGSGIDGFVVLGSPAADACSPLKSRSDSRAAAHRSCWQCREIAQLRQKFGMAKMLVSQQLSSTTMNRTPMSLQVSINMTSSHLLYSMNEISMIKKRY